MASNSIDYYNSYIVYASFIGIIISVYSTYVKWKITKNPKYKALCDVNENMSCTRVLNSKYGKGFGIVGKLFGEKSPLNVSNTVFGVIFYLLQIFLTFNSSSTFLQMISFYTSLLSVIGSIYLAYILYFILKDFCIVCNLSYVVNGLIFYFNWQLYN